jgi:hypothetical protein
MKFLAYWDKQTLGHYLAENGSVRAIIFFMFVENVSIEIRAVLL